MTTYTFTTQFDPADTSSSTSSITSYSVTDGNNIWQDQMPPFLVKGDILEFAFSGPSPLLQYHLHISPMKKMLHLLRPATFQNFTFSPFEGHTGNFNFDLLQENSFTIVQQMGFWDFTVSGNAGTGSNTFFKDPELQVGTNPGANR